MISLLRATVLSLVFALSGCATVHESSSPASAYPGATISASAELPDMSALPEQSAVAAGTKYVVVQSEGGSIFLGPILGGLNISAKTKAMAEQYRHSVMSIDPTPVAFEAMANVGIRDMPTTAMFVVKPFVFVQHCYDDKFRLSLVFHVQGTGQAANFVGRYTYHLPTAYPAAQFANLTSIDLDNYKSELKLGSSILSKLVKRDFANELPVTGKLVKIGSLNLMGNKVGGLGIYTMPEEIAYPNAQLIEETDDHVIVRLKGNMHATGLVGGMLFGVHWIDKKLVHTLKPM